MKTVLLHDEIGMESLIEYLVQREVAIGSAGEKEGFLFLRPRRSIIEEVSHQNPGRWNAVEQTPAKEEADSVDVDRAVVPEKLWVGIKPRDLSEDLVDLNNVGAALLQDVRLYGGEALTCQGAIAEKTEIDDVHVVGEEHDGSHIRGSIGKDGSSGDLLEFGKDGSGDPYPVDRDVRHVHGSLLGAQRLNPSLHAANGE